MTEESLLIAVNLVTEVIAKSNINEFDKLELMRNLQNFLMNYERDLKKLIKENKGQK